MKLFKLLHDWPFWPKDEPKNLYRIVKAGTVVTVTDFQAEVLEGELKGWVGYPARPGHLLEVSALELLAEAGDETL